MKILNYLLILLFPFLLHAGTNLENGKAVKGYDVVEYFVSKKAVKGNSRFAHNYMGAVYEFNSLANLEKFKKSPDQYAPQYGGYCAYAVSLGYTYDIDPEAFDIKNNKLYLNANKSVQRTWKKNAAQFIQDANKNWPKLKE